MWSRFGGFEDVAVRAIVEGSRLRAWMFLRVAFVFLVPQGSPNIDALDL